MTVRDCIQLKEISFRGFHGARSEESTYGQRFWVDLSLYGDFGQAEKSDDLGSTIDYTEVCATVLEASRERPCNLMECLANRIAEAILSRYPVRSVIVELTKKPHGVPGLPREASVRIVREKQV